MIKIMKTTFTIPVYTLTHLGTTILVGTKRRLRKFAKDQWNIRGMALGFETKFKTEEEFYYYLDDDVNLSQFLKTQLGYTITLVCDVTDEDI